LTGIRRGPDPDRVLAIVEATRRAAATGPGKSFSLITTSSSVDSSSATAAAKLTRQATVFLPFLTEQREQSVATKRLPKRSRG
jgi:hypothetical protein